MGAWDSALLLTKRCGRIPNYPSREVPMGPVSLGANRVAVESHSGPAVNSATGHLALDYRRVRPLGSVLSSRRKTAMALSASACLSALR